MNTKYLLAALISFCSASSAAASRTYSGEYGCDRLEDQIERLELMAKAYAAAGARARGVETPRQKAEADGIAQRMVELSSTACVPLHGTFHVLRLHSIDGGHVVLVEHDKGMRQLWVLEP